MVVVLQSDLVDGLATRVIVPLMPIAPMKGGMRGLNPAIMIGDEVYVLKIEFPAAATERELGRYVTNIAHARDDIIRALDLLFTGI